MTYYTYRTKKQLQIFSIGFPLLTGLFCMLTFALTEDVFPRSITCVMVIGSILFSTAVCRSARNTYLKIDDTHLTWIGILTEHPQAKIALSDISKICYMEECSGGYNARSQVILTLTSGAKYTVPVPDDDHYTFFQAITAAAPNAKSLSSSGKIKSDLRYIWQALTYGLLKKE